MAEIVQSWSANTPTYAQTETHILFLPLTSTRKALLHLAKSLPCRHLTSCSIFSRKYLVMDFSKDSQTAFKEFPSAECQWFERWVSLPLWSRWPAKLEIPTSLKRGQHSIWRTLVFLLVGLLERCTVLGEASAAYSSFSDYWCSIREHSGPW